MEMTSNRAGRVSLLALMFCLIIQTSEAGSATWKLNPISNQWQNADNWRPATVPREETDTATFSRSNLTNVALGVWGPDIGEGDTFLYKIVFAADSPAYTITLTPDGVYGDFLSIYGDGVTNESGIVQNIAVGASPGDRSGELFFRNLATISDDVVITNQGGLVPVGAGSGGGATQFLDFSSIGSATLINEGGTVAGAFGGFLGTFDNAAVENATIINNPGIVSDALGGQFLFYSNTAGSVGHSTIICNAATVPGAGGGFAKIEGGGDGGGSAAGAEFVANGAGVAGAEGGKVTIQAGSGYATFTAMGGSAPNAEGGIIDVYNQFDYLLPWTDQTILTAQAGSNAGLGGTILIHQGAGQKLCQFQVIGNGSLDLTSLVRDNAPIGSLAGDGNVNLSNNRLNVGFNNLDTTFSGLIEGSGRILKVGTGTLTLSGASSYEGGTTVREGALKVANRNGSATGTGFVHVTSGTLGGAGIIVGPVTIGAGNNGGGFLTPSVGASGPATLTLLSSLTFKADSTYTWKFNTRNARADQVIASGVAIEAGAQFDFQAVANNKLTAGIIFTAISNISTSAISGTFANLPDGSIFTAGNNTFQVSYEGGDANDLTLTVVP